MGTKLSRRELLAATAGIAVATSTSSYGKILGSNETVGVGLIGAGGQGSHHLSKLVKNPAVRVQAVCDVFTPRREKAAETAKASAIKDFRELLDRKDIGCVWIATPDHWHSRMAIAAMEAGKDVYCEKPMALHWEEARDFYRAAQRTKRVVQIGSQDTSREVWWKARDLVQAGKIGQVVWSQTSICRNIRDGDWKYDVDLKASSHNLDWQAFLGPAPKRPFDPERFFRWRKYWDYSGGIATDLFVHVLHSLCIPLGNPWPVRASAAGGVFIHKDRETPDTFLTLLDYEGGQSIFVAGTQANEQGVPVVIRGHEATMYLSGSEVQVRPERIYGEGRAEETYKTKDVEDSIAAHHENFLACVRIRNPNTHCSAILGYKVDVAVDMAVHAWRENRAMRFDPAREEVLEA